MNLPFLAALGLVSEHSHESEKPVGSPYCSEPNCRYCEELRKLAEELRRKQQSEEVKSSKQEH